MYPIFAFSFVSACGGGYFITKAKIVLTLKILFFVFGFCFGGFCFVFVLWYLFSINYLLLSYE